MKHLFYLLLLSCLLVACKTESPKTIYFVRHAEKDTFSPKDPALSLEGVMRSVDLATFFKGVSVDTIFSSDTKRTLETVDPLSERQKVGVGMYNPMNFEAFAKVLKELEADTIVVVGHSNTLLPQIEALGIARPQEKIGEFEYDKIFRVELAAQTTEIIRYGSKSISEEAEKERENL